MILFWLMWASLALGGMAGVLWYSKGLRGKWLQVARVRPERRPSRHRYSHVSSFSVYGGHLSCPLQCRGSRASPRGAADRPLTFVTLPCPGPRETTARDVEVIPFDFARSDRGPWIGRTAGTDTPVNLGEIVTGPSAASPDRFAGKATGRLKEWPRWTALSRFAWPLWWGCWSVLAFARLQDHFRLSSARASRDEIIAQARKEAENIRKEAELKAKDEMFKKREEFNREIEQARNELREQERRLEKREDSLEQKHQAQLKKERVLRAQPNASCTRRREQLDKTSPELEALLQQQTPEAARDQRPQPRAGREAAAGTARQGAGRRDRRPHPEARGSICAPPPRRRPARSWPPPSSATPPSTPPTPPSAPWTFPATT